MKAREGDQEALLHLWQGVSRLAFKIALRYQNAAALNGAADADDLTQCAFLGFMEALEDFDPMRGNFPTWMCWHVRRACRRLLGLDGRERKEHYHTDSLDAPVPGTEDVTLADMIPDETAVIPFEQAELRHDIDKALHRLPDGIENIIRLHDLEGLPLQEAADRQGIHYNTAQIRRRTGFNRLRKRQDLRSWYIPNYHRHKGLAAFRSTWSSVVEDEVIRSSTGGIDNDSGNHAVCEQLFSAPARVKGNIPSAETP